MEAVSGLRIKQQKELILSTLGAPPTGRGAAPKAEAVKAKLSWGLVLFRWLEEAEGKNPPPEGGCWVPREGALHQQLLTRNRRNP